MKIILVGASGTIGRAVDAALGKRHDIVRVGRQSGDVHADISDAGSIRAMFDRVGEFDALISTTGKVHFGPLDQFTSDQFHIGLRDKLMGQVNLVTLGLPYIRTGGSFTLTSGLLNDDPIPTGASAAMVNGALEGFVHGAAIELPRGVRINLVSPAVIEEALPVYGAYFPGVKAVPAAEAALGYVKSVEGAQTGRVYRIGWTRDA